jgi:hypothetical protein
MPDISRPLPSRRMLSTMASRMRGWRASGQVIVAAQLQGIRARLAAAHDVAAGPGVLHSLAIILVHPQGGEFGEFGIAETGLGRSGGDIAFHDGLLSVGNQVEKYD